MAKRATTSSKKAAKPSAQSPKADSDLGGVMARSFGQTVAAAGALMEARSFGDVIDIQTRCATEAWHQAFDYWTELGETTARTAQKGFFGS
jgi:hypothetical protein